MVYSTDAAKWRAYQFLDPFATGSFYVCNQVSKYFCRPDCDAYPISELRLDIKFVPTAADAVELGYVPCHSCDPLLVPPVDVDLLVATVRDINHTIGFQPPQEEEDKVLVDPPQRRLLAPTMGCHGAYNPDTHTHHAVSKNDSEHCKLVDLACRHLALAAAQSLSSSPLTVASPKLDDDKKSRKRRGGVLGFKELAAKSKLSAWHFHRVFKSVTGLTPKTYGDRCYEYLQKALELGKTLTGAKKPVAATSTVTPTVTPAIALTPTVTTASVPTPTSVTAATSSMAPSVASTYDNNYYKSYASPALSVSLILAQNGRKRSAIEDEYPSPKRTQYMTPVMAPFTDFNAFEEIPAIGFDLRATSAPDLSAYFERPQSLFAKPAEFMPDMQMAENAAVAEFMPAAPLNLMEPVQFDEFGGAGFSTDMFAPLDELAMPELDTGDSFTYGLLPELLMNAGL